jgi:uncharacterized membrane protein YsdA (DUF1294 family)
MQSAAMDDEMVAAIAIGIPIAAIIAFVLYTVFKDQQRDSARRAAQLAEREAAIKRWSELAGPNGVFVPYEGGHPELSSAEQVALRREDLGIAIVLYSGKIVSMPFVAISGVSYESNVQRVNTGGGRSVGGAIIGNMLFGSVGAIVGGQAPTKLQTFDDSRTIFALQYGKVQTQVTFQTTREIHAKIVALLANIAA